MSEKVVTLRGRQIELRVERDGSRFRSGANELELVSLHGDQAGIRVGAKVFVVFFAVDGARISFAFDGEIYGADVVEKGSGTRARHRDHSLAAPMPGLILKILARPGDVVRKGSPLIVLEAMKMEHQIVAPRDGTIEAVDCAEGELVQAGVDLVRMKDEDRR